MKEGRGGGGRRRRIKIKNPPGFTRAVFFPFSLKAVSYNFVSTQIFFFQSPNSFVSFILRVVDYRDLVCLLAVDAYLPSFRKNFFFFRSISVFFFGTR
jgi:hypothetical protein